jgi:small subunit ribosomal protein S17
MNRLKKTLIGKVISDKMNKTAVVEVNRLKKHPVYRKPVQTRKKFYAHTGELEVKNGSLVKIIQSKPFSKLKRWQVIEVVEQPKE